MSQKEWAITTKLVSDSFAILEQQNPMTIRQLFYQLVTREIIPNDKKSYQKISVVMTTARRDGRIPFEYIVDRSRTDYLPGGWDDPNDYFESVSYSYHKDYWKMQPNYVEVWTEKDAIIGSVKPVTDELGVCLRPGKGFQSTTKVHELAQHFRRLNREGKPITVFYLGDHDPSGIGIENSTAQRVREYGVMFDIQRLAIFKADIAEFKLPPQRVKVTDTRTPDFKKQFGVETVELDALPADELRHRIREAIIGRMDTDAWERAMSVEEVEKTSVLSFLGRYNELFPRET